MSEKIYGWLLRLYPSHFRQAHGEEALLLYRDRARDERGLVWRTRLWFDLLLDFAVSVPREYRRAEPALAGASAQRLDGLPGFRLLEEQPPRPGVLFSGAFLSLVGFAAISVLIVHGGSYGNYGSLRIGGDRSPNANAARDSASRNPSQNPAGNGEEKILAANGPATDLSSVEAGDVKPGSVQSKQIPLPGGTEPAQAGTKAAPAQPKPQNATSAMIRAFDSHNIVMFGENHGNKQEYEWLCQLVNTPEFDDRVDDVVLEFGNSLYQKSVDSYIAGEDVPLEQVQKAWRNMIGAVGPVSPVYEQFYKAVREANMKRRGKHQIRIVLGDPYGDWDKIKDAEDLGPYLAHRDEWYAQVVKDEVLARNHRALLIMGEGHFLRRNGPGLVEREIRTAGSNPYLVVFGTNAVGGYDDLDTRFDAWPRPAIVALAGNWVGDLPATPVTTGGSVVGTPLKLADAADALLYVAPRDALTQVNMTRAELDGTAYGKELNRRMMIQVGQPMNSFSEQVESPQYPRPQSPASGGGPHRVPLAPPKSMHDPLPPRPPSQ